MRRSCAWVAFAYGGIRSSAFLCTVSTTGGGGGGGGGGGENNMVMKTFPTVSWK